MAIYRTFKEKLEDFSYFYRSLFSRKDLY